jgi:alkanesulfonate monooxygenase SsuD/methylene tetrahydromethanopterin reductase-like flavin-dependent oxidoreductase (luciferase family)
MVGPGRQMPPLAFPGVVDTGWHDAAMRYSVNVPNFGEFATPEVFAEVARQAEQAGWDALLVWDHVVDQKDLRREIADPWILLTAAALATRRIRLGTAITPVARRRPSKLAREVATLDRLTGGRMVLGAGLGAPVDDEYASFGDTTDTRVLAERLDEGLHALVLQSQFSALLLVVGASSGGLMASSPDRPGEDERRIDWWAPDQAGQQPAQLGDGERDEHAQRGHHDRPPSLLAASGRRARVMARNARAAMARVVCRYQARYWRTW